MSRTADDLDAGPVRAALGRDRVVDEPVVIEVRDVSKAFRIPDRRVDSLKERVAHPFSRVSYRRLEALKHVSFDVRQGEFFGIVGRNGSGKSSLLKIMASIYGADSGRVRMAGRVAPFIELGVGFNPELTARENGVLNGVLMGLTLQEARRRLDAIVDFAELADFIDLKLKNYSSGMMVRLAFAVMVQADADVMLVDEVLAVGDAAFAQKCMDVFHERRRAGRTIVLVTHDMGTVQSLCHRAMLLHEGEVVTVGDPDETALEYFRLNFAESPGSTKSVGLTQEVEAVTDVQTRIVRADVVDEEGRPHENVEQGDPIRIDVALEAIQDLPGPIFILNIVHEDGTVIAGITKDLDGPLDLGRRVRLTGAIENRLMPGRYFLDAWVRQHREARLAVQGLRLLSFVVYGAPRRHGVVMLDADLAAVAEPPDEMAP